MWTLKYRYSNSKTVFWITAWLGTSCVNRGRRKRSRKSCPKSPKQVVQGSQNEFWAREGAVAGSRSRFRRQTTRSGTEIQTKKSLRTPIKSRRRKTRQARLFRLHDWLLSSTHLENRIRFRKWHRRKCRRNSRKTHISSRTNHWLFIILALSAFQTKVSLPR